MVGQVVTHLEQVLLPFGKLGLFALRLLDDGGKIDGKVGGISRPDDGSRRSERGGNCPLSRPDDIVVHNGVSIIGTVNLAGKLAGNASPLFAKNLANFLDLLVAKDGTLKVDLDDEIIKGTLIAKDGALVHPIFKA